MPRRDDLETILIVGSGPIVIGQACEFDYSGTQACKVLQSEGYRVVLVNSNPATIMTDPEFAAATYVEPLDAPSLTRVIERERPDALLPTLGGQTALNLAVELHDAGVLDRFGVELIGANVDAIRVAENRHEFKAAMEEIGLAVPESGFATTLGDAMEVAEQVGYPLIVRPSFILGGGDTGDSITVAPAQTLTDVEYQRMRDAAFACIRRIGVDTGGSNIQFAVNPADGRQQIIEMNPRVSRSSALASKATGFPIAKIAARLAVGYALEEIDNDITRKTPASFEPTIDYVVVKWPRFAFEKFPGAGGELHTSMQSVGEAMALGRTFKQAFVKAMRSRELDVTPEPPQATDALLERLEIPSHDRYELLFEAVRRGASEKELCARTGIDPWYMAELAELARGHDPQAGLERSFKSVDTCAAEFEAETPYFYSGWERRAAHEVRRGDRQSVVILGSGPNRIGQGIEFDYCCVP